MPLQSQVHVNAPLTNLSVAYLQSQDAFVADKVFPVVPVDKASDVYFTYPRGAFNRDEAKARAAGTESAGSDFNLSTDNYSAKVYAFHQDVPDVVRANADASVDVDRDAMEFVTHKMLIQKERKFATTYLSTGVWSYQKTGDASGSVGSGEVLHWSDANSDPIADVAAAATSIHKSTGFRPNKLVLGREVFDVLKNHPDFIDRVKYGQTPGQAAIATRQIMAQIFEVDEVLVMDTVYNSAKEGATDSHAFIGGKSALLVYAPARAGLMTPSAGYTFAWTGYLGAGKPIVVSKFRMDALKSDRVEGESAYDQKLVAADLGAFFGSIVA